MHDFYSSHLHQGHIPTTHASSVTPPHQIHNPTPSYPTSHNGITTMNSPSSYHTSSAVSSSHLSDNQQNITRNESPTSAHQYNNSMNLPPTPNSLVTMIGPNSNNSNSNEASSTPAETIETIASIPTSQTNGHYSPWTSSANTARPPLSPDTNGGLVQPIATNGNQQMHHITASTMQHHNQGSYPLQQPLHPFSHQAGKGFGMAPQHYYWY